MSYGLMSGMLLRKLAIDELKRYEEALDVYD